jgi:hypothetical protein
MGLKRHTERGKGRPTLRRRSAKKAGSLKPVQFSWAHAISATEWKTYGAAMRALRGAQVKFLVGGGFARAAFTGYWRNTKDIDFYVRAEDRVRAQRALIKAGFADYYEKLPYDRAWIYRSYKGNVIVDVIWAMANQRAQVDDDWFRPGAQLTIRGERLSLVPPEELLWCKLYIIQRDRCDWTDVFNLVHEYGPGMDWAYLIRKLEEDVPLLQAMLKVYGWLCPEDVKQLPASLWRALTAAQKTTRSLPPTHDRVRLLDSRMWFGARIAKNQKLEI